MAATAAFYELLGFTFARHQHGKGPEHLASESDTFVLELYPAANGQADGVGLGFAVPRLDDSRRVLIAAGFAAGEPRDQPWGRTLVARDPDGRRVELKQA